MVRKELNMMDLCLVTKTSFFGNHHLRGKNLPTKVVARSRIEISVNTHFHTSLLHTFKKPKRLKRYLSRVKLKK